MLAQFSGAPTRDRSPSTGRAATEYAARRLCAPDGERDDRQRHRSSHDCLRCRAVPTKGSLLSFFRWLLKHHARDLCAMEDIVQTRGLEWAIARPPRLKKSPDVSFRARGMSTRLQDPRTSPAISPVRLEGPAGKCHPQRQDPSRGSECTINFFPHPHRCCPRDRSNIVQRVGIRQFGKRVDCKIPSVHLTWYFRTSWIYPVEVFDA
jgi:hypothetical protein